MALFCTLIPLLIAACGLCADPRVILASDTKSWTLDGNSTRVQRSQLSSICNPPPGHESDTVIVAGSDDNAGIEQITLFFDGVGVIIYGAALNGHPLKDPLTVGFDGAASRGIIGGPDYRTPPIVDPQTGAACDIIVSEITNLGNGSHVVTLSPFSADQRIAVFNATVLTASPETTTVPSSGNTPTVPISTTAGSHTQSSLPAVPTSTTADSHAQSSLLVPSDTSSTTSARGTETLGSTLPTGARSAAASRTLTIVLPSIIVPVLIALLCLCFRFRRRVGPALRPYLERSSHSASDTVPLGKVGAPPSKAGIFRRSYPSGNLPSPNQTASTDAPRVPGRRLDSEMHPVADDATADPEQLIAIQRAVRQAGFSTQALLESLGRVRRGTDTAFHDSAGSAPPRYDA